MRARWSSVPLSVARPLTAAVDERRPQWLEDLDTGGTDPGRTRLAGLRVGAAGRRAPADRGRPVVGVIGIAFAPGRRLTATERATLLALAEQCAQALDRARLYRAEQRIAETLQRSLLPQRLPHLDRLALAARYLPGAEGTQAGGDWYDVVELDDDRVAIAVGDVVGQGPAAAAVMGQLRSALSTALLPGRARPRRWSCSTASPPACPGPRPPRPPAWSWTASAGSSAGRGPGTRRRSSSRRAGASSSTRAGSGTVLGVGGPRTYTEGTAADRARRGAAAVHRRAGRAAGRGRSTADWTGSPRRSAGTAPRRPTGLATLLLRRDPRRHRPARRRRAHRRPAPACTAASNGCRPTRRLAGVRRAVEAWATPAALPTETLEDLQLALGEARGQRRRARLPATGRPGECAVPGGPAAGRRASR